MKSINSEWVAHFLFITFLGVSMKKVITTAKNIWKDESGQGAVEYILLLVVVVGVIALLKDKISPALDQAVGKLSGKIGNFNP